MKGEHQENWLLVEFLELGQTWAAREELRKQRRDHMLRRDGKSITLAVKNGAQLGDCGTCF